MPESLTRSFSRALSSGDNRKATVMLRHRPCESVAFLDIFLLLSQLAQGVRHFLLGGGEQVGVTVGNVNALMAHPVSDGHCAVSLADKQGHMGMPQIMDANFLQPLPFTPQLHFAVKVILRHRKQPVLRLQLVLHPQIIPQFVAKEVGNLHLPLAFGRFGVSNKVPAINMLEGFGNRNGPGL